MRTQCKLLGVHRSTAAYQPVARKAQDTRLCRLLDELYLRDPCLGTRRLVAVLQRDHGISINRKKLQRMRRAMGMEAMALMLLTWHQLQPIQHKRQPLITSRLQIWRVPP